MSNGKPMFTADQFEQLRKMEQCCGDVEGFLQSLESLGLDVDERRGVNETRRAMCARVREVMNRLNQQGQS